MQTSSLCLSCMLQWNSIALCVADMMVVAFASRELAVGASTLRSIASKLWWPVSATFAKLHADFALVPSFNGDCCRAKLIK